MASLELWPTVQRCIKDSVFSSFPMYWGSSKYKKINFEFFMTYSLMPKDMSNRIHEPLNAPFVSSLTPEQVCCLSTHPNHPNVSNCPGCVVGNHQNERLPGLGNEATVLGRVLCEACHVGEFLFRCASISWIGYKSNWGVYNFFVRYWIKGFQTSDLKLQD